MPSEPMRKNLVTLQRLKQNKENSKPCEGTHSGSEALSKQVQIQKPFANSQLSKKSSHSGNLNSHERTHIEDKPFSCQICDKLFSQLGNLKIHGRTHDDEKPFSCPQCDYKCSASSSLKIHEGIHTKPFNCFQCNKKMKVHQVHWNYMKESTLSPSVAPNATRNSADHNIWRLL